MEFPEIEENQLALLMAKKDTGIILNKKLEVYKTDLNIEAYIIFENRDLIYDYTNNIVESDKSIEFMIYDSKNEMIEFIK